MLRQARFTTPCSFTRLWGSNSDLHACTASSSLTYVSFPDFPDLQVFSPMMFWSTSKVSMHPSVEWGSDYRTEKDPTVGRLVHLLFKGLCKTLNSAWGIATLVSYLQHGVALVSSVWSCSGWGAPLRWFVAQKMQAVWDSWDAEVFIQCNFSDSFPVTFKSSPSQHAVCRLRYWTR